MITKLKTTIFLLLMAVSLSISASTTFLDDFNRPNSKQVGSGWYEIEHNRNDVRINKEQIVLRDNADGRIDAAIIRVMVGDYTSSILSFDWKPLIRSKNSDLFMVGYVELLEGVTPAITNLFTTGLGDNTRTWNSESISLENTPTTPFLLVFYTKLRGECNRFEGVRLDNISITDNISNVPIPPVGVLAGLVGSILLVTRRKTNEN